ncbi:MAG: histidine--tRNA ligase [bacterium]
MTKISNQPPKGTSDWMPEELKIRQYIFKVWRQVCLSYGYQEYLTPLVESAEVYEAKSGEDVGKKELMTFDDKAGRKLAIRPEMTPSVTRLISRIYDAEQKPIRYFSIANFMRNEKPQRGRNREFWQLNYDVFGANSLNADIEVAQIALDIMLQFNPSADSFKLALNNRKLIDKVLDIVEIAEDKKQDVVRILDKWEKLSVKDFQSALNNLGVDSNRQEKLIQFMSVKNLDDLVRQIPEIAENQGLKEVRQTMYRLDELGYGEWVVFKPSVIRGFDYYDGLIFEVFDMSDQNSRAIFGGGRYNGLADIFGSKSFPAVGCAPGDETIKLFLETWGLLDEIKQSIKEDVYYLPILSKELTVDIQQLARKLRKEGKQVETGLEVQKINKALEYANKKNVSRVVIFGTEEKKKRIYKIKDMNNSEEKEIKM